jgi:hypothetical protein
VRVSYDGASDCDPSGTAHWTLDGIAQGELEDIDAGVGCRFDPNTAPGGVLGLLVLLGSWPRRKSAARPGPRASPGPAAVLPWRPCTTTRGRGEGAGCS